MTKKKAVKAENVDAENVDAAIDEVMGQIAEHRCASADVPPSVSVEFYEGIAEQAADIASGLREEHGVER